jgi:hypothetical protein
MNTDNTETVQTFSHDGHEVQIDHLGITHPSPRGDYAVYIEGEQIGEFCGWEGQELDDDDQRNYAIDIVNEWLEER